MLAAARAVADAARKLASMVKLLGKIVQIAKIADKITAGMERNRKLHEDFKELSTLKLEGMT